MPDPLPLETKTAWLQELTALQEDISAERLAVLVGTSQRALLETACDGYIEARLADNSVVRVSGDDTLLGRYATVRIDDARSWIMTGEILSVEE
jgi:tRNA A37 methylthiotransferase MiaB